MQSTGLQLFQWTCNVGCTSTGVQSTRFQVFEWTNHLGVEKTCMQSTRLQWFERSHHVDSTSLQDLAYSYLKGHTMWRLQAPVYSVQQGSPLGKNFTSQLATRYLFLVASAIFWSPVGYWNFFFGRQCHFLVAKTVFSLVMSYMPSPFVFLENTSMSL